MVMQYSLRFLLSQAILFANVRNTMLSLLQERVLMGFTVDIESPVYKEVTVDVTIFIVEGAVFDTVKTRVETQIARWLDPLSKDDDGEYINSFGKDLRLSDLGLLIKSVPEIYDYVIHQPTGNVDIPDNQLPTTNHSVTTVTGRHSVVLSHHLVNTPSPTFGGYKIF